MARFYVNPKSLFQNKFLITDRNLCNHLRQVLRISKGAVVELFDGTGYEYKAEIRFLDKEQVSGVILEKKSSEEEYPYIILAQAFPKAGKADEIVRMNTEVGVSEFLFFKSEYSVPQLGSYDDKKIDWMQRVAIEAARQSERGILPKIRQADTFDEMMNVKADVKLMLHSRSDGTTLDIGEAKKLFGKGKTVLIAIGPEGGFSPAEIGKATKAGFKIVHMNLPIMRTETAGVVISSYLIA